MLGTGSPRTRRAGGSTCRRWLAVVASPAAAAALRAFIVLQPDPRRARAVLVPAEGAPGRAGGDRRRALARDDDRRLDRRDLASRSQGRSRGRRSCCVGASGYLRTERWSRRLAWLALGGARVGPGRERPPVPRPGDVHGLLAVAYVGGRGSSTTCGTGRSGAGAAWTAEPASSRSCRSRTSRSWSRRLALIARLEPAGGLRRARRHPPRAARAGRPIDPNGIWAGWPLALGVAPGAYAGAAVLLAVPLALRRARATRAGGHLRAGARR